MEFIAWQKLVQLILLILLSDILYYLYKIAIIFIYENKYHGNLILFKALENFSSMYYFKSLGTSYANIGTEFESSFFDSSISTIAIK